MKIGITEFRTRCLPLIDRVATRGESIVITKRGRVVAKLVPAADDDDRPWLRLRGTARWTGDPFAPAVDEDEVDALR